jgi:hypothetical protein
MNTLQAIKFNILGGIIGAFIGKTDKWTYKKSETLIEKNESDQDVLYRKQREYMRTNHW